MADMDGVRRQIDDMAVDDRRRTLQYLNESLNEQPAGEQPAGEQPAGEHQAQGAAALPQHRVVTETHSRPPPRKLRLFSGKAPVPSGEVDFESWKLTALQLMEDESFSEEVKKITLVQALVRPALEIIRSIISTTDSKGCLDLLDNVYGQVQDGHDLLVDFYITYQDQKESASTFLNRLYLKLVQVTEKGGLAVGEIPTVLLRQFIRGSQDDSFAQHLQLEAKFDDPPSFGKLLLDVRKEECRRTERRLRLKQTSVNVKAQTTEVGKTSHATDMEARVQQLTTELEKLKSERSQTKPKWEQKGPKTDRTQGSHNKKRNFFCYKCGVDGHKVDTCKKQSNPELVQQRLMSKCQKPTKDLNDQQHS